MWKWLEDFFEKYIIADWDDLPKPRMIRRWDNKYQYDYWICYCEMGGIKIEGRGLDQKTAYRNWIKDLEKVGY